MRFFKLFPFKRQSQATDVRFGRTLEGTIFEAAGALVVIALWVIAVLLYRHSPETIPTHFDVAGNPDDYGSPLTLIILAAIGTLLIVLMFIGAYKPTSMISVPVKMETLTQHLLASRMVRILAIILGGLFISIMFMIGYPTLPLPHYAMFAFVGLLFVVPLFFTVLIVRARNREEL